MNRKWDIITVIGYMVAFGCLLGSIVLSEGGFENLILFWNPAAFVVAFGGAFFAVCIQFSFKDIITMPSVLKNIFAYNKVKYEEVIDSIVKFAEKARREGILALEKDLDGVKDLFLAKGLRLAIDGTPPDVIETTLNLELNSMIERHENGIKFFDQLATFSPAFGMLGTIMHLALVLVHLDDPTKVGPSMARALLSTLYGVMGCYFLYAPIANKLTYRSKEETFLKKIIIKGITSIQAGDNPRIIEEKLRSFLRTKTLAVPGSK